MSDTFGTVHVLVLKPMINKFIIFFCYLFFLKIAFLERSHFGMLLNCYIVFILTSSLTLAIDMAGSPNSRNKKSNTGFRGLFEDVLKILFANL